MSGWACLIPDGPVNCLSVIQGFIGFAGGGGGGGGGGGDGGGGGGWGATVFPSSLTNPGGFILWGGVTVGGRGTGTLPIENCGGGGGGGGGGVIGTPIENC